MTDRFRCYTLLLSISLVAAVSSFVRASEPEGVVSRIKRLMVPGENETRAEADLRRLSLLARLMHTKNLSQEDADSLTRMVNAILDDERVLDNLESASAAALVAGRLRLKRCIPTLVRRITLPSPPQPRGHPIRDNPFGAPPPAMTALISIGEPAVPAVRELAERKDLTEIERVAARAVLLQIELKKARHNANPSIGESRKGTDTTIPKDANKQIKDTGTSKKSIAAAHQVFPQRHLLQVVQKAEADSAGESFAAIKTAVAAAAKSVIEEHMLDAIRNDGTDWGKMFHSVKIQDEVIVVTGNNYWWSLRPVLKNDRLIEVKIKASPICLD